MSNYLSDLYKTHISLTEWLEHIEHKDSKAMRAEDNDKRKRLQILNQTIGLPYDKPFECLATDIANKTDVFTQFLADHGHEACALRLIPFNPELPKLRMRGLTIKDAIEWFYAQNIDPAQYRADFVPHPEKDLWGTIFVINENGIFGEIIHGGHNQLTQGMHTVGRPITFSYNWNDWTWSEDDSDAKEHVQFIVNHLLVKDSNLQKIVEEKLDATFAHDFLQGYFETATGEPSGMWFIDYNRILGELYKDFSISNFVAADEAILKGRIGSTGTAEGKVCIVFPEQIETVQFEEGNILVCPMTTPLYISLIQKAGAVITDMGGILSHAAIVCRELKKPCIVGAGNATSVLKDGDSVSVDAGIGVVTKL